MKVVIIGGVAGGASAAARLRRLDESAEIVILERGDYISYANCGLPYYIGGEITDRRELVLQTPESFSGRFRVDVRLGNEATAIDPKAKTVSVTRLADGSTYEEPYDKLLLSPGAEPIRPPIDGADDPRVFTLRTIPDTFRIREFIENNLPKKAVVIGGGYIGVEMAENLAREGIDVSIVELLPHLIAPLDLDAAADLHRYVREKGISLFLGEGVSSIERARTGLTIKTGTHDIPADFAILSVGVRPESALAKTAGIDLGARGAILTDDHMRTSVADIYAVGDAVEVQNFVSERPGYLPLAGPANRQGRIAADNIAGLDSAYKGTQGSAILKVFDMTVAATGLSEEAVKAAGIPYDKVYTYSASHATYYPGATMMALKLLFRVPDGRVLGAQIVGFDGVDKRMDVVATAIRLNATVYDLTELELCYAPPFSSAKDPVNMAGFAAENILSGRVKQFHWHDVPALQQRTDVTLLDVRTPAEYERGHIDGTVHIPLDSLRDSLGRLDPSKPIYVNCQSGLRSYIACRILSQNGFDCYNLGGG
ncbi:FAD-dependent oxidoreductase, partial [Oscillospiraceae bacterium OttesenSCG-928-G22]|nr:FAD-dependent oxidoreductase [Oscillospiraceae bacterium OttesenSCG-928-G22]